VAEPSRAPHSTAESSHLLFSHPIDVVLSRYSVLFSAFFMQPDPSAPTFYISTWSGGVLPLFEFASVF
jgi:hypothetical protein